MNRLAFALTALATGFFAGCSSGTSDPGTGTVSLVLTDSATDELTQFEVDVDGIVFEKASGATVSVLSRATRVDFLQLESLAELVAAGSLEAGFYDRITVTLDFASARILIEGQTTPAAVLDQDGDPITGSYDVDVDLTTGARPFVRAGRGHLLVLDLDLEQSVAVDAGANTITFAPVWTVQTDPNGPDPIVTSGTLQSVDLANDVFYVERRAVDDTVVDVFAVRTAPATIYQLGGVARLGAFGFGSLVDHLGQRVYVQGTFDADDRAIDAVAVETGAGVPGNGQDWVYGHVVARTGPAGGDAQLTVIGRSVDVSTGTRTYNTLHTVDVSLADTKVLRRGFGDTYGTDAINVGQRVWIFGDLTGTSLDATSTDGVVRMLRTSIFGIANGPVVADTLTLDLTRFGLRDVAQFDFDVSGQVQADPDAFTIDVAGLSTGAIAADSRLRVFGFLSPVGASGPDADALSIVDRTTGAKLLWCQWAPPRTGVLDAEGQSGAVAIDVTQALIRVVADGFAPTTLTDAPTPTLVPLLTGGFYRIVQDGGVVVYTSFSEFRLGVAARTANTAVARVSAFGTFDAGTQTFSALTATVVLD